MVIPLSKLLSDSDSGIAVQIRSDANSLKDNTCPGAQARLRELAPRREIPRQVDTRIVVSHVAFRG